MNIKCDKCCEEFSLENKDIITKEIDNLHISVRYFECKHCSEKYITECIDNYISKEKRRYEKLTDNDKKIKCLSNMKLHSDRLKLKVIDLL